jgi:hypothetical protein
MSLLLGLVTGLIQTVRAEGEIELFPILPAGDYMALSSQELAYIDKSKAYLGDLDELLYFRAQQICEAIGFAGYPKDKKPSTHELLVSDSGAASRSSNSPASPLIADAIPDEVQAYTAQDGKFELKKFQGEKPYFFSDGKAPWFSNSNQLYFNGVVVGAGFITAAGSIYPPLGLIGGTIQCVAGACSGVCGYFRDCLKNESGQTEVRKMSYEEAVTRFEKNVTSRKIVANDRKKIPHQLFDRSMVKSCSHSSEFAKQDFNISKLMKCVADINSSENCNPEH